MRTKWVKYKGMGMSYAKKTWCLYIHVLAKLHDCKKKKKTKKPPKNSVLCGNVFAVYFPSDVKWSIT